MYSTMLGTLSDSQSVRTVQKVEYSPINFVLSGIVSLSGVIASCGHEVWV